MKIEQANALAQRLVLSPSMQQSLKCLQLPVLELAEYIQNEILSNPLLEVVLPKAQVSLHHEDMSKEASLPIELREQEVWKKARRKEDEDTLSVGELSGAGQSFTEYLYEQLGQMKLFEEYFLDKCYYLVACLDNRGYLDCALSDIARETGWALDDLEQALFSIQMLDPPGVGARNLSECLILQLAQGEAFNELTVRMAREGLDLLAVQDFDGLAKRFNVSKDEVCHAAKAIEDLNPIPARGFNDGNLIAYTVPDAVVRFEQTHLVIELNNDFLPTLSINNDYAMLLHNDDYKEAKPYITEKLSQAKALMNSVDMRNTTLHRIITELVKIQQEFFIASGPLCPITMTQLAEKLEISPSTVSRAVQGKLIQFQGKALPLRSFFTTTLHTETGDISSLTVKQHLQNFVEREDPSAPLSDDALRLALSSSKIDISRRTVAKYRTQLGIPSASKRRRAKRQTS